MVQYLGVIIDQPLKISTHMSNIVRSGYYHLRQLITVICALTTTAAVTLVHAFM